MLKVLVVDDDDFIRNIVQQTLAMQDYEVFTASNGEEALEQVSAQGPDVVLLDVDMPGRFNGLDVCRKITAKKGGPAVIMVTGRSSPEQRAEGLLAGASTYLTKPFSPLEVIGCLESVQEEARGES